MGIAFISRDLCLLSRGAESLIKLFFKKLKLSARSHDRILKRVRMQKCMWITSIGYSPINKPG